jgi:hypothetical protein
MKEPSIVDQWRELGKLFDKIGLGLGNNNYHFKSKNIF